MRIDLERVKQTDAHAQEYITNHYTNPRGFIGKVTTHLIVVDSKVCGVIVGGSTSMHLHGRQDYFGDCDIQSIINNRLFRLEQNTPNLGTQVLKLWRQTVVQNWKDTYNTIPIGFETLVLPPRTGAVYKADNWDYVGMTKGWSARCPNGHKNGVRVWYKTDPRLVFMKRIKHR